MTEGESLEWRFRALEQRAESIDHQVRVIAPFVQQIGGHEAAIERLQTDVAELKALTRELDQGMTQVIRAGRAETLKYLALIVGPAMLAAGAIVVALVTGKAPLP
jgi:uncharacterized coiled-coil protein SlyX